MGGGGRWQEGLAEKRRHVARGGQQASRWAGSAARQSCHQSSAAGGAGPPPHCAALRCCMLALPPPHLSTGHATSSSSMEVPGLRAAPTMGMRPRRTSQNTLKSLGSCLNS